MLLLVSFAGVLGTSRSVDAQPNFSWDGSSGTGWGLSANWTPQPSPVSQLDGANLTFNATGVTGPQTINLNGNRSPRKLIFKSSDPVRIQEGTGTAPCCELTVGAGGIDVQIGAGVVNIDAPITVGNSNGHWINNSQPSGIPIPTRLFINGRVQLAGRTLTIEGGGSTEITGSLRSSAAGGKLVKSGGGRLILSGSSSSSADGTTVFDGGIVEAASPVNLLNGTLEFTGGQFSTTGGGDFGTRPILMTGNGTINTTGNHATFSGSLAGGGWLTKDGGGTLTYAGNAAGYTGTVVVNAGTLEVFVSSLPSSVVNNSFISLNGDGAYGGVVSGGTINKYGSGNVHLSNGSMNYARLNVVNGTLSGYAGSLRNHIDLQSSSTAVYFQQETGSTFSGTVTGFGALYKQGAGEVDLTNANTHTGGSYLQGGRLVVSDSSQLGNGVVQLLGGGLRAKASFDLNRSLDVATTGVLDTGPHNVTISSQINGGGTLTKTGSGFLSLLNQTNSTFGVNVQGGVLQGTTSSIRGPLSIATNTQVNFNQNSTGDFNSAISGGGIVSVTGGGRVNLNAASPSWSGGLSVTTSTVGANGSTLGTGLISLNGGLLELTSTANVTNPVSLIANSAVNTGYHVTMSGNINGGGGLTKQGGGTLTLSGANNYLGGTTISAGALVASAANIGSGTVTLNGGTLRTSSSSTFAQNVTLAGGLGSIDTLSSSPTLAGTVTGSGTLHKTGWGTLILTGDNSYMGGNTVSLHYLQGSTRSIKGPINFVDSTDDKGVYFDQNEVGQFDSVISGDGWVTKNGIGTLTLAADNTYDGVTTVNAGTLQIGAGGNTGSISNLSNVNNGSALIFNRGNDYSYSGGISGSGTVTKNGAGKLTLAGGSTYSGVTTINAGTLQIGAGGNTGYISDLSSVVNNSALVFNRSNAYSYSGAISGTGSVTKLGAGTLTLSGGAVNTYTGGTIVEQGTLVLDKPTGDASNNYGSAVGDLSVSSTATARLDGHAQIRNDATVTLNGGTLDFATYTDDFKKLDIVNGIVTGAPGSIFYPFGTGVGITSSGVSRIDVTTVPFANGIHVFDGQLTFIGAIAYDSRVSAGIVKSGPGTLKLQAANTYAGNTVVDEGVLEVNGSITSPIVSVNTGGTLRGAGTISGSVSVATGGTLKGTPTIQGNVSGPGRVAPGNSPGILTINGDYTQSADSVLEIEVGALTPGPGPVGNPNAGHDKLIVGGTARLAGTITFPLINNFAPQLNDSIAFLTANPVDLNVVPRSILAPGLDALNNSDNNPLNDLAVRVDATAADLKLTYVEKQNVIFTDSTNGTADWFVGGGWSTGVHPESDDDTTVQGNLGGFNLLQKVEVKSDAMGNGRVAQVHGLTVRDNASPVVISVLADNKLDAVTSDIVIGTGGAIELQGGTVVVAATQELDVRETGMLTGQGMVTGSVTVGTTAGPSGAILSPGINPTGSQIGVGTLNITGDYAQGAGGLYEVDITGNHLGANNDKLDVTGNITLGTTPGTGGTLRLDVSDLTNAELTFGAPYIIATSAGLSGTFGDIEVIGRDDLVAHVNYGAPAAGAGLAQGTTVGLATSVSFAVGGDGDNDEDVDDDDAIMFAAALLDPNVESVRLPNGQEVLPNFFERFDLVPSGQRSIDFFDVPKFAEQMTLYPRQNQAMSLDEAYVAIERAIAIVQGELSIPEPSSLSLVAFGIGIVWTSRRRAANR